MPMRYEIRLTGSGGQGLILAGVILAEAAGLHDGKFVCQTQSYGPAARGGASMAEVVLSDAEIDYPKVVKPDVLLALNQQSLDAYGTDLQPGGLLIVDATFVREVREIPDHQRVVAIPFTEIAREQTGKALSANIVALGALAALTGAVTLKSLKAAVLARVPPATGEMNKRALAAGVQAAARLLREEKPPQPGEEEEGAG
jgi:2-oxoglutarate ferredoxin oxidoreductase subunit gamma